MSNQGTPKTLQGAIRNGVEEYLSTKGATLSAPWLAGELIERHVKDFLNQHFCTAILRAEQAEECGSHALASGNLKALYQRLTVQDPGIYCPNHPARPLDEKEKDCCECRAEAAEAQHG